MQGDAIASNVVFLQAGPVDASRAFRSSDFPQQQARTYSSPTGEESAARNTWNRNHHNVPLVHFSRCSFRNRSSLHTRTLSLSTKPYGKSKMDRSLTRKSVPETCRVAVSSVGEIAGTKTVDRQTNAPTRSRVL